MLNKRIFIIIVLMLCPMVGLQAQPKLQQTIVFMRHAEKPIFDYGQLNCQGLNRAIHLPQVLLAKFGKPDIIFAPNPFFEDYYYYIRALATIEPTAILLDMPVDNRFSFFDYESFADELLRSKYHGSVLFVAWEHTFVVFVMERVLKLLGISDTVVPTWPNSDYDSLYVMNIDWSKYPPVINFVHDYENLNNQNTSCSLPIETSPSVTNYKSLVFLPSAEWNENKDQLSCQGLNRALALPQVLARMLPKIDHIVLMKRENHETSFIRSLMTIEPTIIARGSNYIPEGKTPVDIIEFSQKELERGKVMMIVWRIEDIGNLIQAVYQEHGGNPQEIENPIRDHDTIYEIRLSDENKPLLLKRSAYLNGQPSHCPASHLD